MSTQTEKTEPPKKNGKGKMAPNLAAGVAAPEGESTTSPQRKQLEVPGTAPPRNRKVENAALKYRTAFLERIDRARNEDAARGHLKMIMQQENVRSCRITDGEGDEIVFVLDQPDAKVKMKKVDGDSPAGEDAD